MTQYPLGGRQPDQLRPLSALEQQNLQQIGYGPYWPTPSASVRISDEDVQRIAQAVVRLLRETTP